jgi:hypothetical protein
MVAGLMRIRCVVYHMMACDENLRRHNESRPSRGRHKTLLIINNGRALSNNAVDNVPHIMGDFCEISATGFELTLRWIHWDVSPFRRTKKEPIMAEGGGIGPRSSKGTAVYRTAPSAN